MHRGSIHGAKASLNKVKHQVYYHNTKHWSAPPSMSYVAFTSEDDKEIIYPHDGPLVVSLQISTTMIHRILVDGGSSANIQYKDTFEKMGLEVSCRNPVSYPVIRFIGVCRPIRDQ